MLYLAKAKDEAVLRETFISTTAWLILPGGLHLLLSWLTDVNKHRLFKKTKTHTFCSQTCTNTCLNTFVALWKFLKSYRNLSRNVNFKRSGWLSGRRELASCILRSALQFASWRTEYYKLGPAFHREASPAFTEVLSEWWQISCSNVSRRHLHLPLQLWDHQCCITGPVAAFFF